MRPEPLLDRIDVRDLIARYSGAEHAAKADAYFAAMPANPKLLRKPFFGLRDTPANLYGASEVLTRLRLFPGADVLDFGAGTGWLSKLLAFIECRPVAVDVSGTALDLGRRAFEADPVAAGLKVDWRRFEGERLPLDDASVDRVVCYDSFHHVADQAAVLREFYRVLRGGGRVVFHEPGPRHSLTPLSQMEMREHGVVENDIVLEDIWRVAEELGFTRLRIAPAMPVSPSLTLELYGRLMHGEPSEADVACLLKAMRDGGDNLRIFSFDKGEQVLDSRHGIGLGGHIAVTLTSRDADGLSGQARVTNTGRARWRPSIDEPGGVFLGVNACDAVVSGDFARIWLSKSGVAPGETVTVEFRIKAPILFPVVLKFDLIAEHVVWFETIGCRPVTIRLE